MQDKEEILEEKTPTHLVQILPGHDVLSPSSEKQPVDVNLVTFLLPTDSDNPKDWSTTRKWVITLILSATGFNRIMVSTIMAPVLPVIAKDFHMTEIESLMSMSAYLLSTAIVPLIFAPLSEIYGRGIILHTTNIWFLLWNVVCGFVRNKQGLIAARALAGFGAGAAYFLGTSVLGDLWDAKHRGRSLGFTSVVQNLAAAVGPIVGAIIAGHTNWRWIFWSTSIFQATITIASILAFRETYAPLILQRRAKHLRDTTANAQLYSPLDKLCENRTPMEILQRSLARPIKLLFLHPIVAIQALLSAFSYGITYLIVTTYSNIWTSRYGESISTSGLHYIAMCIGGIIGAQIGGRLMELIFRHLNDKATTEQDKNKPEFHLPMMLPGTLFTVIGMLWYGWAAQYKIFWINVDIGAGVLAGGLILIGMPLMAYIIDVYPEHASSAQAASQMLRSLTAFAFPLFAPSMYAALGYGWANTMLALISVLITLPAPIVIWIYGDRLRRNAKDSF